MRDGRGGGRSKGRRRSRRPHCLPCRSSSGRLSSSPVVCRGDTPRESGELFLCDTLASNDIYRVRTSTHTSASPFTFRPPVGSSDAVSIGLVSCQTFPWESSLRVSGGMSGHAHPQLHLATARAGDSSCVLTCPLFWTSRPTAVSVFVCLFVCLFQVLATGGQQ